MILRVKFLIEGKIRYSLNLENLSYFSKIRWNGPAHIYIYIITSIHNKIFKQYNSRSTTIQKTLCQAISKIQTKWYKNSNLSFHPIIEKTVWKFLGRLIPIIVEILFIRVQSFFSNIYHFQSLEILFNFVEMNTIQKGFVPKVSPKCHFFSSIFLEKFTYNVTRTEHKF